MPSSRRLHERSSGRWAASSRRFSGGGFLARRGYELDDIRRVLSEIDSSLDANDNADTDDAERDGDVSGD